MQRPLQLLWDFGWVDYEPVLLAGVDTASNAPSAYVSSPAFGTSFVGPQRDDFSDIHGPFRREAVSAADFAVLSPIEFRRKVSELRQPDGFAEPASDEQWATVEAVLADICDRCIAIYMLRLTEQDHDRFHDWGYVLTIFREFILVEPDLTVTRLVFGYD